MSKVIARMEQVETDFTIESSAATINHSEGRLFGAHATACNDSPIFERVKLRDRPRVVRLAKRVFDLTFVLSFLALFWWLVLGVAIAVYISDPGPVVYGHTRIGRLGKRFRCWKFRSMVTNSSDVLERLLADDPAARMEWETTFKLKSDPRITKFGQFMRRTSLDELPQLWNILVGQMSVVGPRPVTREEITKYYGPSRRHYISVRPGLTGPWQVGGRNDVSYAERVALDRGYVNTWSIAGDLVLVYQTIAVVFKREGAY